MNDIDIMFLLRRKNEFTYRYKCIFHIYLCPTWKTFRTRARPPMRFLIENTNDVEFSRLISDCNSSFDSSLFIIFNASWSAISSSNVDDRC
jgi:hypothetical protein